MQSCSCTCLLSLYLRHGRFRTFSSSRAHFCCHAKHSFLVIASSVLSCRARARNPAHGCFTSFSMTRVMSCRTLLVMACTLFPCHAERSEESTMDASTALHFVQHDRVMSCRMLSVIACTWSWHARFCLAIPSTFFPVMPSTLFLVVPSTLSLSFRAPFPCHSEPERGIQRMYSSLRCASFSMTVYRQDA